MSGLVLTNIVRQDVTRDPAFDASVCVDCGGLIGCEFCPGQRRMLPPIIDADPGDETDHERTA